MGSKRRVITHLNADLDAITATWATSRLWLKEEVELVFVSAHSDGSEFSEDDIIIDIYAGGKGIKGQMDDQDVQHSAFAYLVDKYGSEEDKTALAELVAFVDAQDSYGSAIAYLAPEINEHARDVLAFSAINAVHRGFQRWTFECGLYSSQEERDQALCELMWKSLDGMYLNGLSRLKAEQEADVLPQYFASGKIVFLDNARYRATSYIVRKRGALLVVYRDGNNLGVTSNASLGDRLRMDHPRIKALIEAAGESADWHCPKDGRFCSHGTSKSPAERPSRVNVQELIAILEELLAEAGL